MLDPGPCPCAADEVGHPPHGAEPSGQLDEGRAGSSPLASTFCTLHPLPCPKFRRPSGRGAVPGEGTGRSGVGSAIATCLVPGVPFRALPCTNPWTGSKARGVYGEAEQCVGQGTVPRGHTGDFAWTERACKNGP